MSSAAAPEPVRDAMSIRASARVSELFERHGRMVYGICRAMLRDVHEAEDATQQVFLNAHRALLGRGRVRDTGAWIATIARNECRARIAAGMTTPLPVAGDGLAETVDPVDDVERRLLAEELREALAMLPERQREAVVLRYIYGLRYGEVATALGLSRPATDALLFRARRALRTRLRPVAGAVLVVPLAVREELALALPGFTVRAGSGAAAGLAGGLLAKLTAAPVGAKLATAAVAVSTVGAVGAAETERPSRGEFEGAPIVRISTGPSSVQSRSAPSEPQVSGDHERRGSDDEAGRGPAREADYGDGESTGAGQHERRESNETERAESSGTGSEVKEVEDRSGFGSPPESRSSESSDSEEADTSDSDDSDEVPDDDSSGPGSGSEDDSEADDESDETEEP